MSNKLVGNLVGADLRVAIACSRFNETIVERLRDGAIDGLVRHGVAEASITEIWVPGALELPIAAKKLAASGNHDAVITLGCVIRGATSHYDVVVGQCASGVTHAALETGVPIIFGVLTTDTIDQALERSGTKAGNKGFEAAMAAIEMANLLPQIA